MRNLYRYQSSPETPQINLKRIIDAMADSEEKADCAAVLCTPSRKKVYDAVWTAMTDIGTLRSSLRLPGNSSFPGSFKLASGTPMRSLSDYKRSIQRLEGNSSNSSGSSNSSRLRPGFITAFVIVCVAAFISVVFALLMDGANTRSNIPSTSSGSMPSLTASAPGSKPPPPSPALPPKPLPPPLPAPKPLPSSGALNSYLPGLHANMDAPFEIRTSAGANYLLKMEHWESGRAILDVFVRGGDRVEIKVPVGTYRVKYASGKTWYGYEDLFGPRTSFSKADTSFQFKRTFDGYSGYTITLYKVQNGNLSTSKIGASDF